MTSYQLLIPSDLTVQWAPPHYKVQGPLGKINLVMPRSLPFHFTLTSTCLVLTPTSSLSSQSVIQTYIALLHQSFRGVLTGFRTHLELRGIGYRVRRVDTVLELKLGFSHLVHYPIPKGLTVTCPKPTRIVIQGVNSQQVHQFRHRLQTLRYPEPYKGKGIFYQHQQIRRKQGKKS